jgi:hypothetical protein
LPALPGQHDSAAWLKAVEHAWQTESRRSSDPSLWRVVWSVTKSRLIYSGVLRGIEVGLNFGMVYAVTAVIEFLNGQSSSGHMAVAAALLLFVRTARL